MNRRPWTHAAASAALALFAAVAAATPGPPLSCGGQPGVGGCAPFVNISFTDAAGSVDLFEYDLPGIDIGRSGPLSDLRGMADLEHGTMAVSSRQAPDNNPSEPSGVLVRSSLADVFTLHSTTGVPPGGAPINIVVMATAQGVGGIDVDYNGVQSFLHLTLGSGIASTSGSVLDAGAAVQSVVQWPTFQQFVLPLQVFANLGVQVEVPFELDFWLQTNVSEGSFLNFESFLGLAHPAQITFQLPPGFRVTSLGGFDTASPVPEPEALSLWLAGLGMLGCWLRARRGWPRR